jgi:hypothetical protein
LLHSRFGGENVNQLDRYLGSLSLLDGKPKRSTSDCLLRCRENEVISLKAITEVFVFLSA